MGVRHLHRKALEKVLVNGVEKRLFLAKVINRGRGAFNCQIETVQRFEKFAAAKLARGQRLHHFFDFVGDHIAFNKIGVRKDGAKDALGEHMLDQHLFDCLR